MTAPDPRCAEHSMTGPEHDACQPDQFGTVIRAGREVTVPVAPIPQHNRPDGRWCRWSGCDTAEPHGWCPDRCQAPGIAAQLNDPNGRARPVPARPGPRAGHANAGDTGSRLLSPRGSPMARRQRSRCATAGSSAAPSARDDGPPLPPSSWCREHCGRGLVLDPDVGRDERGNVLVRLRCRQGPYAVRDRTTPAPATRLPVRHHQVMQTTAGKTTPQPTHGLHLHPLYKTWVALTDRPGPRAVATPPTATAEARRYGPAGYAAWLARHRPSWAERPPRPDSRRAPRGARWLSRWIRITQPGGTEAGYVATTSAGRPRRSPLSCSARNHPDRKWRLVCRPPAGELPRRPRRPHVPEPRRCRPRGI